MKIEESTNFFAFLKFSFGISGSGHWVRRQCGLVLFLGAGIRAMSLGATARLSPLLQFLSELSSYRHGDLLNLTVTIAGDLRGTVKKKADFSVFL